MASQRTGSAQQNGEREQTRRLVLERVSVVVLPDDVDHAQVVEALKPLLKRRSGVERAWVERGEFDGSIVSAVESYAGKPGTADAKVGTFKAPPARSMRGGVVYTQPSLPKVERTVLR